MGLMTRFRCVIGCATALLVLPLSMASGAGYQTPKRTIWDGVYTEDQAKRGERIYGQKCTLCHRDDLRGNSVDGGPPLRGEVFTSAWDYQSLGALVKTAQTLMPPEQPGSLTIQEYVDVLTFILWANGAPPGAGELPIDSEKLEGILFTATRPAP